MANSKVKSENENESIFVAYANIDLWGGNLEGIINTPEKFYSLKTVKPIKLSDVKIGSLAIGEEVKKANLGLENLTVNFLVEHKGGEAKDDYTKMFFAVETPPAEATTELNKGDFLGSDFKINSLKVGYLNYGANATEQKDNLISWMDENVNRLD